MMLGRFLVSMLLAVAVAAAGAAAAQTPHERTGVAIVIFIDARSQPEIQPFDELEAGRTIPLGKGETMELGYFDSCVMEAITGGAVTIGARESKVKGGEILREKVDCANMRFQHGVAQLQFAAAAVFERSTAGGGGAGGAITGGGDVADWSGAAPSVPDQLDILVGPLLRELDGRRRLAVMPVEPVAGVATAEAAAGTRNYLIARIRAESPHALIADDQLTGLRLLPGDALDAATRQRLRSVGAEAVVACLMDDNGEEISLSCEAQMVDEDVVVGHGAVVLARGGGGGAAEKGTSAITE